MVAGTVVGVWPGRGQASNPPWGQVLAPPARGSSASCCVARRAPGVLRVRAVSALPASVPWRLWGGKGLSSNGAGPSVTSHRRLLEGLLQAPEEIRVVLGRGELAEVDSLRMQRISQHGFPCGLRHPSPRQPESRVLRRLLRGRRTRPWREGSAQPHFRSFNSCVWVQRCHHAPRAGSLALFVGMGVGVGARGGVMGTGGGGGPAGILVVLCREGV